MSLPHGAYAPIPTPIGEDGLFDPEALGRHLAMLDRGGLSGALVMGTNGEFPSFDLDERRTAAETAARGRRDLSLMLGIGSCALPEVTRLLRIGRDLGFDSVLVPPPFYFRSAPIRGLIAFFLEVLESAELPVLLYHIPQVTGIEISDEILDGVARHPRFGGVKDSSGSEDQLERFTTRLDGLSYMVGNDRLLSASIDAGGGSITAVASVVPELVSATGEDPGRQPELDAVRSLLESFGLGPAVKAILRSKGVGAYRTRLPLLGLDDTAAAELVAEFEALTGA